MSTYTLDLNAMQPRFTGIVEPVMEWTDGPNGTKVRSNIQRRDRSTELPLWEVEVVYLTSVFGKPGSETARVQVPAENPPALGAFDLVPFDSLTLRINNGRESLSANGIATHTGRESKAA